MKVLMISGDKNLLNPESNAGKRLALQRACVDRLDVFVWPQEHSLLQIFQAVRQNSYDVITAQDPFWRGHLAHHLSQISGAALNIQVHTDLSAEPKWRRWWAGFQLRSASAVRVVSKALEEQVRATGTKAKIRLLPIFVDLSRFQKLTRVPHDQQTMLWIGRFEQEKNPRQAVDILRDVRARGVNVKLVMLGSGTLVETVRKAAKGMPVELPGWKDPADYLRIADVVVCTSRFESWGASIVEALAAGVPVVAPDVGVAREAGAQIAERGNVVEKIIEVLEQKVPGKLLLTLPTAEEWAVRWRETLV